MLSDLFNTNMTSTTSSLLPLFTCSYTLVRLLFCVYIIMMLDRLMYLGLLVKVFFLHYHFHPSFIPLFYLFVPDLFPQISVNFWVSFISTRDVPQLL